MMPRNALVSSTSLTLTTAAAAAGAEAEAAAPLLIDTLLWRGVSLTEATMAALSRHLQTHAAGTKPHTQTCHIICHSMIEQLTAGSMHCLSHCLAVAGNFSLHMLRLCSKRLLAESIGMILSSMILQ